MSLYDAARRAMDDVLGPGAYAEANRNSGDPRIQEQVKASEVEADDGDGGCPCADYEDDDDGTCWCGHVEDEHTQGGFFKPCLM